MNKPPDSRHRPVFLGLSTPALTAEEALKEAFIRMQPTVLPANGVVPLLNAAGDKLPNVIPWTANVDAEYSRDIGTVWANTRSYIRVDYRWLGAVNALDPNVVGFDYQIGPHQNPAYGVLNIRLGVLHEGLDLSAYVNNATNSDPVLNYTHDNLPDTAWAGGST